MSVTSTQATEKAAFLKQVDRLVNSHILHGSESLCQMLQYLARHALDHPGVSVKEYHIATDILGRSVDFDPQLDATVRVQTGRLRKKLAEYYGTVGSEDPVIVELPKGTHALSFRFRPLPNSNESTSQNGAVLTGNRLKKQKTVRYLVIAVSILSVLLAVAIATIVANNVARKSPQSLHADQHEFVPPAFQIFWGPFIGGPEEPWVIFGNAPFVGRPETGIRFYDPAQDPPDHVLVGYTGVGEVFAVRDLDRVFALLERTARVKQGTMFTLDDAKNNNLIFVGSPVSNFTLREIPSTHEFTFQRLSSGARKGDLAIINLHPQPGEARIFLPEPAIPPLAEDYSIIALLRGLNPARATLILAGTSTVGTQAAVEFVCRPDSVQELLSRLKVSNTSELKPFEAVLQVEVKHDVPIEAKIVALRTPSL